MSPHFDRPWSTINRKNNIEFIPYEKTNCIFTLKSVKNATFPPSDKGRVAQVIVIGTTINCPITHFATTRVIFARFVNTFRLFDGDFKIGICVLCGVERLPVSSQEIARTAYRYESLAIVNLFVFAVNYVWLEFLLCCDRFRGHPIKNCEGNEQGMIFDFMVCWISAVKCLKQSNDSLVRP